MKNYLNLLREIYTKGVDREGRNGGTRALFFQQLRWNMADGFPLLTTKKIPFNYIVGELLWFISGSTNDGDLARLCRLPEGKDTIWSANMRDFQNRVGPNSPDPSYPYNFLPKDSLGRIYGAQWRNWRGGNGDGCDQLALLVDRLRKNPHDRRHVVTAWNPTDVELGRMALPPCHMMFHVCCADGKLNLHMVQRSCDMMLGVPFNIASYGLLLHLLAYDVEMTPGELVITFNDAHIYHDHFEAVDIQLEREPGSLPSIWFNREQVNRTSFQSLLFDWRPENIILENYQPQPNIPCRMIV